METDKTTKADRADRKRKRRSGHVSKSSKMPARMETPPEVKPEAVEDSKPYDEYYVNETYCIDRKLNEFYARLRTGDESYLTVEGKPTYAFKKTDQGNKAAILAVDRTGTSNYAFDGENRPIFPTVDGKRTYAVDEFQNQVYPHDPVTFDEIYLIDENGSPVFAKDRKGRKTYAVRTLYDMKVEVPPRNPDGTAVMIELENGRVQVPFNVTTGRPEYGLNDDNDQVYFKDDAGDEYYAADEEGNEWYATDARNNERFATKADGTPFYRVDSQGNQKYPVTKDNHEVYITCGSQQMYAATCDGEGYYAKLNDGSEYYPRNYTFEDYDDEVEVLDQMTPQ